MPGKKTEATELAVAFGLLKKDPLSVSYGEIGPLFSGTLTPEKFSAFLEEYGGSENTPLYRRMYKLGEKVRQAYKPFGNITSLKWSGPDRTSPSVSSSRDLEVNGSTAVSVKTNSNVVYNLSPVNLFNMAPSSESFVKNTENWYLKCAPEEFDNLYRAIAHLLPFSYLNAEGFESAASKDERRMVQKVIQGLAGSLATDFQNKYIAMCRKVAEVSASKFNENHKNTMKRKKAQAYEYLLKVFFRLNSSLYLMVGLDRNKEFALVVPSITDWKKEWGLKNITAEADTNRQQCVVNFKVTCKNKKSKQEAAFNFRAEVRWSHGKFCGNPEAKLYKEFLWKDLLFVEKLF